MTFSKTELINLITEFLQKIGLEFEYAEIDHSTFLPGLNINAGVLQIDKEKLLYPGDILHEAGHLAMELPEKRIELSGDLKDVRPDGNTYELGAILWSYAVAKHIGIDERIVFHEEGYKGEADWLIEQFNNQVYIGLPLLQWMEMAYEKTTEINGELIPAFPHMHKWLRE